jgi:hypothetical protein
VMRTGCAIATGIKLRSAGQCGRRSFLWKKPKPRSDGLDALREVMSLRDIAGYIERLPRLKADARRKKKPLPIERGQDQTRLHRPPIKPPY